MAPKNNPKGKGKAATVSPEPEEQAGPSNYESDDDDEPSQALGPPLERSRRARPITDAQFVDYIDRAIDQALQRRPPPLADEERLIQLINKVLDAREERSNRSLPQADVVIEPLVTEPLAHRLRQNAESADPIRVVEATPPKDRLRTEELGLFDPEIMNDALPDNLIVIEGRHTVYKEVYTFLDRLQVVATSYSEFEVIQTWTKCLRGQALLWHTAELSADDRNRLSFASLKDVSDALIRRFKLDTVAALEALRRSRYGLAQVKHGTHIQIHLALSFAYARHVGVLDEYVLLIQVWNSLEPEIQALVDEPSPLETRAQFMARANQKWTVLRGLARRPNVHAAPPIRPNSTNQSSGSWNPFKNQPGNHVQPNSWSNRQQQQRLPESTSNSGRKLIGNSEVRKAYQDAVASGKRDVGFFAVNDDGTMEELPVEWNAASGTSEDAVD